MTDRWTVASLARSAAELLQSRGFESARLEADLLLAESLGLERLELYTRFDMPVDDDRRAAFRALIKRRLAHEPVAYILGRRDFLEHRFRVGPGVLIPRPESEHLVEAALAVLPEDRDLRLLEVGVGSGCLLLSILAARPRAQGIGLDREDAPLEFSARNAEALGVGDRVEILKSDLFSALKERPDHRVDLDLIISNPPYIRQDERAGLAPDVRDHEPHAALFVEGDGLVFHRRILREGAAMLGERGIVVLELPGEGGGELRALLREELPDWTCVVLPDLAGRERVLVTGRNLDSGRFSGHPEPSETS